MALAVIGAGFGRTGTLSLKLALEGLGFGPCYHMTEALERPERMAHWVRAAQGKAMDWDRVFEGYRATVDWPACDYWRELARAYPKAKVILTVRDPESWYFSTQSTIFGPTGAPLVAEREGLAQVTKAIAKRNFGGMLTGRGRLIGAFERHNREVAETLPADRLLVFRVSEGWGSLCGFLGVAIPPTPFPFVNTTEEFATYARTHVGSAPLERP